MEARGLDRIRRVRVNLLFILFSIAAGALATSISATISVGQEQQPMHHDHAGNQGIDMSMDEPMDEAAHAKLEAKILADKKESEFNHHLAGFLVALAGVFVLFQPNLAQRWSSVKYVWPACFLVAGGLFFVWGGNPILSFWRLPKLGEPAK